MQCSLRRHVKWLWRGKRPWINRALHCDLKTRQQHFLSSHTAHSSPSHHSAASPQLEGAPLLVLAHKHDAPSAADAGTVGAALGLGAVASDSDEGAPSRRFVILETSCTDAQGLFAALDWALGARAR